MEILNIENSSGIILRGEKILLLYKPKDNHAEIPGGGIKPGETIEETAIRETKEETGLDVGLERYLGYIDFEMPGKKIRSHNFLAKVKENQEPQLTEPERFTKILWVPMKEHQKYPCAPNAHIFCENFVQTRKLELPNANEYHLKK